MKTPLLFCSALAGAMMLSAAPVLAQDTTVVVEKPTPPVVVEPVNQTPPTVVVNGPSAPAAENGPRRYPGLIWGGIALWGTAYSASVIGGAIANDACDASNKLCVQNRWILFLPIAGPFAALPYVKGPASNTLQAMLAIDGAFQLGGAAMAITGAIMSAGDSARRRPVAQRDVIITPFTTPTSAGLGAIGRF